MQRQKIRDSSPEVQEPSIQESQQSHEVLLSKHLIPPPLMLLPKEVDNKAKSLLPMIPLPNFVGIIPNFQPLQSLSEDSTLKRQTYFNWIGDAFDNIVYRKYEEASYCKIDDAEENWNIWACDVAKLTSQKSNQQKDQKDEQIKPFYKSKNSQDKTIIFESRFESGNLSLVSKVTDIEYNLLLQNDINTNGYSQWFFFKVSNASKGSKVRFNILNLFKHNSLYKSGMKIIIYSTKESQEKNISWHRGGDNIEYYQNGYSKSTSEFKPFYTLSWQYTFNYADDQVYFAYNYPYTFSNLCTLYEKIEADHFTRNICQRSLLCKTLAGNNVHVLTITQNHPFQELDKGYIIITARIHPGQSVSSYVCNGILQFLISSDEKAKKLRQNFIFKIVPMMNPDGVIHGNYRSNCSGFDLNRKWENPSKIYHPEIYYCKKMIQSLNQAGQVLLFCDLHGHSMKKNAFIYGSHDSFNPRSGKEFPMLISKLFKGFSFKDCSFLKKQQKQGTTRAVLLKQISNNNIYTLESSFCGPQYEDIHFTVRHFEELGEKFCESLLIFFRNKIKEMQIDAAMKDKSFFPSNNHDQSSDSLMEYQSLIDFKQIDEMAIRDRINSENSQGSEPENESLTMLEEKTIKKYLVIKNSRPQTTFLGRRNFNSRKSMSKDITAKFQDKKVEFHIHKSNSPTKRKELYQLPKGEKRPKLEIQKLEKVKVEPKIFEPIEFLSTGLEKKRNQRSNSRLGYESEKGLKNEGTKSGVKLILNKNYEFKAQEKEPVFKNSTLRGFIKQQTSKHRRSSEFIIRKNNKITFADDKNSTNLFKSVLSSLRKDKK